MAHDVDREPAAFATRRARQLTGQMHVAFAAGMGLLAVVIYSAFGLRSTLLELAALTALYAVYRTFVRREVLSRRWTRGANAEREVGSVLNELRQEGFLVLHDL